MVIALEFEVGKAKRQYLAQLSSSFRAVTTGAKQRLDVIMVSEGTITMELEA